MDGVDILERVREVVSDVLGVAVTGIEPDDRLVEDLEAEKLQILELADALEEEFDVEVDEDEFLALSTVGELAEMMADLAGEDYEGDEEDEDEDDE
jgi:acyl carrier protein